MGCNDSSIGNKNTSLSNRIESSPTSPKGEKKDDDFALYWLQDKLEIDNNGIVLNQVKLEKQPFLTSKDVEDYFWSGSELRVYKESLRKKLNNQLPLKGRAFVLVVNGEKVKLGMFWTALSSLSPPSNIPIYYIDSPDGVSTITIF